MKSGLKRLLFYWATSFAIATIVYYILWVIMPHHYVFGVFFRMFLYHWEHPITFIMIPCFFYGIFATLLAGNFSTLSDKRQILLTVIIIVLTIIASSPFGGMLWHYYDMKAGYFPSNWLEVMIIRGADWGFKIGWFIVLMSLPYNIIGSIVCYYLTYKGSELFKTNKNSTQQTV